MGAALDKVLAFARKQDLTVSLALGTPIRIASYGRMGPDAMRNHLTAGGHGMEGHHFGGDFAHPQHLAAWHGIDHMARGDALDHTHHEGNAVSGGAVRSVHSAEHAVSHAGHGGGEHHHLPGSHLPGLLGHMAAWEVPAGVHREVRRTIDRQTRRPIERHLHHMRGAGKPPGGASAPSGASGGSSGSSSGGGSSSSSGSGNSGTR